MQNAQNSDGTQPHPSVHRVENSAQEGIGVPFPQSGTSQSVASGGQNVLSVLALALGGLHDSTADRFARLDTVVCGLAASVTEVREAARMDSLKLAEWLDRAHERQMKATMLVLERLRALERTIGEVESLNGDETITARMQRVDCALTELLEQVQDPQAGFMTPTRHLVEKGTDPITSTRMFVEAGVDAPQTVYRDVHVTASAPLPVLQDATVNTTDRTMADASTEASPDKVDIATLKDTTKLVDAAVGNSFRLYMDSGTDAPTPEETERMHTPKDMRLHACFPTSPYHSDPMVPAQWSPERSAPDSPRSVLSYLDPDDVGVQEDPNVVSPACIGTLPLEKDHATVDDVDAVPPVPGDPTPAVPRVDGDAQPAAQSLPSPSFPPAEGRSTDIPCLPRFASAASGSIAPSNSSATAVNSPSDNNVPTTAANHTSKSETLPKQLPLPRHSTYQIERKKPGIRTPSMSPSPSPPPPPPPPRRKVQALPRTQPQTSSPWNQTKNIQPVRGRSPMRRDPSSSDVEIIERPASFVDRNRSGGRERNKSNVKLEKKKAKARSRASEITSEAERLHPRKRRKTDGDMVAQMEKKPVGRLRKTLAGEAPQSQSRKGKQAARQFPDSSPDPPPVKLPVTQTKSRTRMIADDVDCQWPEFIEGDETYEHEYINCDNCDAWFHYGCVGLSLDDPRLKEQDSSFFCPPCEVAGIQRKGRHSTEQESDSAQCARPDCQSPGSNQWFVDRIIGRMASQTQPGSHGMPKLLWLVRWQGWGASDATWEFPENLGEHSQLVAEFEVAAQLEGKDLSDPHATALLNEASHAGWG